MICFIERDGRPLNIPIKKMKSLIHGIVPYEADRGSGSDRYEQIILQYDLFFFSGMGHGIFQHLYFFLKVVLKGDLSRLFIQLT